MFADLFGSSANVFSAVLKMSFTASWLIIAVIAIRFLFKKAPKWINCLLWAMVAIRLVVPFSFESVLSLIPSEQKLSQALTVTAPSNVIIPATEPSSVYVASSLSGGATQQISSALEAAARPSDTGEISSLGILSIVWIVGIVLMLTYTFISYLKLLKSVGPSIKTEKNVYICDNIKSPFILGIIKPKIYLPSSIGENEADFVISHERAHLKRLDNIWKPLGFTVLSLHWFNPLCWVAYILLSKDIELACDERVIKEYDIENKRCYSQTLLNCSTGTSRRMVTACPLAFGENGVKERIRSVLSYKKPTFWVIASAVVVCAATSVFLMTNPVSDATDRLLGAEYKVEKIIYDEVTGKKANTNLEDCPEYCITGDNYLYIKWQGSDAWNNCGALTPFAVSKDDVMSLCKSNMIHRYTGGNIKQSYRVGDEYIIFVGEDGSVYHAGVSFEGDKLKSISRISKLESQFNKNDFNVDFYARSLDSQKDMIGENVELFSFLSSDKIQGYRVIGFKKELTSRKRMAGIAAFEISNKGCKLSFVKTLYDESADDSGIYVTDSPIVFGNDKVFDFVISCNEGLVKAERSFGDNIQSINVSGEANIVLFDVVQEEFADDSADISYKFYDKSGNVIKRIDKIERDFESVQNDFGAESGDTAVKDIDTAVSKALLNIAAADSSLGECAAEGHIIYGTKKDGSNVSVYAYIETEAYGFINGSFVDVSGSFCPAVLEFTNINGKYEFKDINYPEDGSLYAGSVKEMFPRLYAYRALYVSSSENRKLDKQAERYAAAYLESIGRKARICSYGELELTTLSHLGVSVEAEDVITESSFAKNSLTFGSYPYWIGNCEYLIDGHRYILETSYVKESETIVYSGYSDTSEANERIEFDARTGEMLFYSDGGLEQVFSNAFNCDFEPASVPEASLMQLLTEKFYRNYDLGENNDLSGFGLSEKVLDFLNNKAYYQTQSKKKNDINISKSDYKLEIAYLTSTDDGEYTTYVFAVKAIFGYENSGESALSSEEVRIVVKNETDEIVDFITPMNHYDIAIRGGKGTAPLYELSDKEIARRQGSVHKDIGFPSH